MLGSLYFLVTRDALGNRCTKQLRCIHDDAAIALATKFSGALRLEDARGHLLWRAP